MAAKKNSLLWKLKNIYFMKNNTGMYTWDYS